MTRSFERARDALQCSVEPASYRNLLASWTFAAAVILPAPLMVGVIVACGIGEWPARKLAGKAILYRHVYTTAAVVPAALAARAIIGSALPFDLALPLGAIVNVIVNSLVVGAAMMAVGQGGVIRILLQPSTCKYEAATLLIALAQIELFRHHQAPMMWLSLPATIAIQRYAVRTELRAAGKPASRPMSGEAWLIAGTEVVAALPVVAILRVNSAATEVAAEIARLQAGVDAIGYVGSSGLGMVLVDCPARSADALADRLRMALRHNGIEASVAAAAKPRDGHTLTELFVACEAELALQEALRGKTQQGW
ncbi:MAG TPA: hypothetical protein VFU36_02840 [Jatrophihabitans sp.]|nr:hypothetical protein [Jatrophihabitans sp.]